MELGTVTGTATIGANDELTATVISQDDKVLEGNSATFVVRLENEANELSTSSASVEIDYTVTGSGNPAADEDDFSPEKGTLTIPAGRSTGTIKVEALDDDILEPDETLQVTLTEAVPANVVSVATGAPGSATTDIGASDSPARVSVADVTVDEGETAMIEVKVSKEVSSPVSVTYSLNPPPGMDYSNPTPLSPLVFAAGETAKTIEIQTTQDTLAEDEEKFTVTLQRHRTATATVVEPVQLSSNGYDHRRRVAATIEGPASVDEGDAAVYTVTVTGGTFGTGEDDQVTVTWSTEESKRDVPTTSRRPAGRWTSARKSRRRRSRSRPRTTTSRNSARKSW